MPVQAAFFNVAGWLSSTMHLSGWSANLLEVGGKDTPVMNAISNILNNAPGCASPWVRQPARDPTGSESTSATDHMRRAGTCFRCEITARRM